MASNLCKDHSKRLLQQGNPITLFVCVGQIILGIRNYGIQRRKEKTYYLLNKNILEKKITLPTFIIYYQHLKIKDT